jgi:hypothetical protein
MAVESTPRVALGFRHAGRTAAAPLVVSPRLALALIVALSAALRTIGAIAHPVPNLFPDEYIYTALARSLGSSGLPLIRGSLAHFPALLGPLLAAPIWSLAPTTVAYHLVQVENALFMSLAAIPAYLLSRKVGLATRYSLACALFAVAIPDLAFAARTLAGPTAYPLVLAALYAAVVALTRPTRGTQIAFLTLAFLATLARVQYVVLFAAYFATLIATLRRDVFHTHRLSLGVLLAGALGGIAIGPARLLGYYGGVVRLHTGAATLHWIATDLFLLAVASGVVLVPGAVVGLATTRGRDQTSFAVLAVCYAATLLLEAGLYASNGADRFQERYLFSLLPLIPIAFGLYLKNGRSARLSVVAVAALLLLVSMRVPLSGFAVSTGSTDSPFLWAVVKLQSLLGIGSASLLVAAYTAGATGVAILIAFGLRARVAVVGCLIVLAAASAAATAADVRTSRLVRSTLDTPDLSWVDRSHVGDVTVVATGPNDGRVTEQLYWNRSVTREVLFGAGKPTDTFEAPTVTVAHDGALETPAGPLRGPILFEQYGETVLFQDATRVAATPSFALWRPRRTARLALLEDRYDDGWLAASGSLALWPRDGKPLRGVLRLTVSLPVGSKPQRLSFGSRNATIRGGTRRSFAFCVDSARRWRISFHAPGSALPDFRRVSVLQTAPRFVQGASCRPPRGT